MAPPSYALATASFTSKASPKAPKTITIPTTSVPSKTEEKKPKRPSLLTPEKKQSLTYTQNLHHIKPSNASLPCPFATLPSELRSQIWIFVFLPQSPQSPTNSPPPLLKTCRALRIEAAYTYYTHTPMHFTIRNLDFSPIKTWYTRLLPSHRIHLSKNKNLHITITTTLQKTYTYPPKNWLFDADIHTHWRACAKWGNIYDIRNDMHKLHFSLFCRWAAWWVWCAKYPMMQWGYAFETQRGGGKGEVVAFLRERVGVVGMACVGRAWTRSKEAEEVERVREQALRWLEGVDRWYKGRYGDEGDEEWCGSMAVVRRTVENW